MFLKGILDGVRNRCQVQNSKVVHKKTAAGREGKQYQRIILKQIVFRLNLELHFHVPAQGTYFKQKNWDLFEKSH